MSTRLDEVAAISEQRRGTLERFLEVDGRREPLVPVVGGVEMKAAVLDPGPSPMISLMTTSGLAEFLTAEFPFWIRRTFN